MMSFQIQCVSNDKLSFGKKSRNDVKHLKAKYAFDKKVYKKKIQSVAIANQHKKESLGLIQDIIDMTQYFKDEDILYEVLTEFERDFVFYEICTWYKRIRG